MSPARSRGAFGGAHRNLASAASPLGPRERSMGPEPVDPARTNVDYAAIGEQLIRLLLSKGADPLQTTERLGSFPLWSAARLGNLRFVRALLEAIPPGPESLNKVQRVSGASSLAVAASHGFVAVVHELIRRGADVNLATVDGNTPLDLAASAGHLDALMLLLRAGGGSGGVVGFIVPEKVDGYIGDAHVTSILKAGGAREARPSRAVAQAVRAREAGGGGVGMGIPLAGSSANAAVRKQTSLTLDDTEGDAADAWARKPVQTWTVIDVVQYLRVRIPAPGKLNEQSIMYQNNQGMGLVQLLTRSPLLAGAESDASLLRWWRSPEETPRVSLDLPDAELIQALDAMHAEVDAWLEPYKIHFIAQRDLSAPTLDAQQKLAAAGTIRPTASDAFVALSAGNFGATFRSRWNGKEIVLKVSKHRQSEVEWQELAALSSLRRHDRIVNLVGLCPCFSPFAAASDSATGASAATGDDDEQQLSEFSKFAVVMDYVPGGDVRAFAAAHGAAITVGQVAALLADMAEALHEIHRLGIVHRDIRAANFLVASDSRAQLADFGLARRVDGVRMRTPATEGEMLPWRWCPPEVMLDQFFGIKSDVWMLGMALVELVTLGRPPLIGALHTPKEVGDAMRAARESRPDTVPGSAPVYPSFAVAIPDDLDQGLVDILRGCLRVDIRKRPSAAQVMDQAKALLAKPERAGALARDAAATAALADAAAVDGDESMYGAYVVTEMD